LTTPVLDRTMPEQRRRTAVRGGSMHLVFAYIDAGTGSLLIQALIAALVAAPFVLRQQIGRLMRRLRGIPEASTTVPDADPVE
jgi:hypothetical protein